MNVSVASEGLSLYSRLLAESLGSNLPANDCLHSLSKQFVTWKCCAGQIGFEGLRKSKASG